jgi:hypothetical protein
VFQKFLTSFFLSFFGQAEEPTPSFETYSLNSKIQGDLSIRPEDSLGINDEDVMDTSPGPDTPASNGLIFTTPDTGVPRSDDTSTSRSPLEHRNEGIENTDTSGLEVTSAEISNQHSLQVINDNPGLMPATSEQQSRPTSPQDFNGELTTQDPPTWTQDEELEAATHYTTSINSDGTGSIGSTSNWRRRFSRRRISTGTIVTADSPPLIPGTSKLNFSASGNMLHVWTRGESRSFVRMRFTQELDSLKVRGQCLPLYAGKRPSTMDIRHVAGGDLSVAAFAIRANKRWILYYNEQGACISQAFEHGQDTVKALAVSRDDRLVCVACEGVGYVYRRDAARLHHIGTIQAERHPPGTIRLQTVNFSLDSSKVLLVSQVCFPGTFKVSHCTQSFKMCRGYLSTAAPVKTLILPTMW